MKRLIRKILKEETISGRDYNDPINVSDKQQRVLDYAVKDIVNNIELFGIVCYKPIDNPQGHF